MTFYMLKNGVGGWFETGQDFGDRSDSGDWWVGYFAVVVNPFAGLCPFETDSGICCSSHFPLHVTLPLTITPTPYPSLLPHACPSQPASRRASTAAQTDWTGKT